MSDPVTNIDIEDVLASIRRLVSDTGREAPRAPAAERLVLTPALRVAPAPQTVPQPVPHPVSGAGHPDMPQVDPDDTAAMAEDVPTVDPVAATVLTMTGAPHRGEAAPRPPGRAATRDDGDAASRLARTIAELEAALGVGSGEWEPDGSETAATQDGTDADPLSPAEPAAFAPLILPQAAVAPPQDLPDAPPDTAAMPGAAVDQGPAAFAPDAPPPEWDLSPAVAQLPPAEAGPAGDPPLIPVPGPVPAASPASAAASAPGPASAPHVGPAAFRPQSAPAADVARRPAAFDPAPLLAEAVLAGVLHDPLADAPLAFHSHRAAAQAAATPEDRAEDDDWPEAMAGIGAAFLQEDAVVDEATLRALVIDIVRQELQGTLGERITRNVRKLVRREIYRVLSSEEFS